MFVPIPVKEKQLLSGLRNQPKKIRTFFVLNEPPKSPAERRDPDSFSFSPPCRIPYNRSPLPTLGDPQHIANPNACYEWGFEESETADNSTSPGRSLVQ